MTPAEILKKTLSLTSDKTDLIDSIIAAMEKKIGTAQDALLRKMIEDFVDKLDKNDDGTIKNSLANKRKINTLDKIYQQYLVNDGAEIVNAVVDNVGKIIDFNGRYYSLFSGKAELGNILSETKQTIQDWLGIGRRGNLIENGYLYKLVKDQTVRDRIRNDVFKSVIAQRGYNEVKAGLRDYIKGNEEHTGALQQYYRGFVYDTFSVIDRSQALTFADKLKLNYAIYEGQKMKTSRAFCLKRKGKVFTREEISKFDPSKEGTAIPDNYNPFLNLGSYNCIDHLSWIPYEVAVLLRKDLKKPE